MSGCKNDARFAEAQRHSNVTREVLTVPRQPSAWLDFIARRGK